MKPRGFTLVELVVVMAVFTVALGFVFVNFRYVDRREELKSLSLATEAMATKAQAWTIGNHPDPRLPGNGVPLVGYGLEIGRTGNPLWQPRIVAIQGTGASFSAIPMESLAQDVRIGLLEVFALRIGQDTASNCTNMTLGEPPMYVYFTPPRGLPAIIAGVSTTAPIETDARAFIYYRQTEQNICRRISIFSSGQISETRVDCPSPACL